MKCFQSVFLCAVVSALPVCAQAQALSEPQKVELTQWVQDQAKWLSWMDQNRNRVLWTYWGGVAKRKTEPPPPAWLKEECSTVGPQSRDAVLVTACEYLSDSEEGYQVVQDRRKARQAQAHQEKTVHSLFHVRMHIDSMYTATSTGSSTYGLIGMHLTFAELGRVQFFIPPGVMLYEVPKAGGGHRLVPATTAGVSIRLFETDLFGRAVNLHLNFAKAWVSGTIAPSTDVMGLSFTFKK